MPPFQHESPQTADDESWSVISHKSLPYVRIETKVADAETLSTRLIEGDDDDADGEEDTNHSCVSFDSRRPLLRLCCFYMILVTSNIIVLSSDEDFEADNWWKISNVCNVVSGCLGFMAAIYRSKAICAFVACWWLFEMFFSMYRLAIMNWSIIPDTSIRSWYMAYAVISYAVRLLLVCVATIFVSQNGEQTRGRGAPLHLQRIDYDDAVVVFV